MEPILQEVVQGDLMSFQAVMDREGRMLAPVQQLSPRTWPPDSGSAARSHTVAMDAVLAAPGGAPSSGSLGWFGLAQLQFIAPHDGGEPRLIDLNGRYYSSLALAVASGPNLPGIWARLATEPARRVGPAVRARITPTSGSAATCAPHGVRRGSAARRARMRISAGSVHSVWRHDDPWPSVHHYSAQLAASGGRRLQAVVNFLAALGAGSGFL